MLFKNVTIKAAIFDMDGTMFDTERLRFELLKTASKEIQGFPLDDEILIDCFGLNMASAEKITKMKYGSNYPYKKIRDRAEELEMAFVKERGMPFKPGLIELLERFKQNGIKMAVATSSKRALAAKHLELAGVLEYFDAIVCGDEVTQGKPHPEIFLKSAEKIGVDPKEALGLEDSENGAKASLDAGLVTILLVDIKEPSPAILDKVFRKYDSLHAFLMDLKSEMPKMKLPDIQDPFPLKMNDKVIGIHGLGAIGGGYWTQIFSHWDGYTRPKKIIGATNNNILRRLINTCGKFQVNYAEIHFKQTIDNVHAIDMSSEKDMVDMYLNSDIIALCLPEGAIHKQAPVIAKGLLQRYRKNQKDLSILFILNKIDGTKFIKQHVASALQKISSDKEAESILSRTKFISTVVNRIVSRISNEKICKEIRKQVENLAKSNSINLYRDIGFFDEDEVYTPDLITNEAFKANIFKKVLKTLSSLMRRELVLKNIEVTEDLLRLLFLIVNFKDLKITLFNCEPMMKIYAQSGCTMIENLRQVETVKDITKIEVMKNRLSNGPHAMIAWYSSLLGYKTIGQGMSDSRVLNLIQDAIEFEIKPVLLQGESELSESQLNIFSKNFIQRCKESVNDPCIRVGRDPLRKLKAGDRIIGTIELAKNFGIPTPNLEFGVAVAILYALHDMNPEDDECKKIKEIYYKRKSIKDVLIYNGFVNEKHFHCLDAKEHKEIISRIEKYFNKLAATITHYMDDRFLS